ncbi:uncharacterized protein LOC113075883 isoform X1 [Carassius auratus]|uniref:Uncharacterized protein LOC113075883 isoform X1 n=1 Tax=Carassius auratus TaxID=7957 RepID=A0A6P6N7M2_CARAU|nr:uncharacterized protein LOC113075883 isoform X1 [Carassius auratus]
MKAVNAVQLFSLFWTFTALCQADEDISVSCEKVTGSVGKEGNLHCSVSVNCSNCSIIMYKFKYPNESTICTEPPKDSCKQSNILTCRYTPTTAINNTEEFSFFVQTTCGMKTTKFTVDITESFIFNETHVAESTNAVSMDAVITPVVGLSVIFIIIIILMAIISKKQSFGFQKRMCIKNDDGNSNCLEEVIYSNIDSAKPN